MSNGFTPEIAKEIINALNATNSLVQSWAPEMATLKAELKHLREKFDEVENIVKGNNGDSLRSKLDKLGYLVETCNKEIERVTESVKSLEKDSKKYVEDFEKNCDLYKSELDKLKGVVLTLDKLEKKEEKNDKAEAQKWTFKTKVVTGLITGVVTIATAIITYLAAK